MNAQDLQRKASMSDKLNDPAVLGRLCDAVSRIISALHVNGMIQKNVSRLLIDVVDTEKHHFIVKWGDHPEELSLDDVSSYTFDEYAIGVNGGGLQSEAIASVVAEAIKASLAMLEDEKKITAGW